VPTPGLRWARRWWYQPRLWQQAGGEGRSNGQPNARASRPAGEAADRGQHPSRPIWTTCHDQAPPAACSRAELFQSSLICTCLSLEGDSSLQAAAQPGKSTPLRQQAVITSHLYHFRAQALATDSHCQNPLQIVTRSGQNLASAGWQKTRTLRALVAQ